MKLIISILLAVFLLDGCSKKELEPYVVILNLLPSNENVLTAGQCVDINVVAEARNIKEEGDLSLVVQGSDGSSLGLDGPVPVSNRVPHTFHAKFKVPPVASISIFTPYLKKGESESSTLDRRIYRVVG